MAVEVTVALAAWLATTAAASPPVTGEGATVFFVRHAEKAQATAADPELSAAGRARAELLARTLRDVRVTHLFASEYVRTRATLEPLAKALGLRVQRVPAAASRRLLEALRALPGGAVAVVAGHSNTVPGLVRALGGELRGLDPTARPPSFYDDEYDRLVVIVGVGTEAVKSLELRYGEERASARRAR